MSNLHPESGTDTELLHATDPLGRIVRTAGRVELLAEMRRYVEQYGDVPFAVPAVHVILMTSDGRMRLVKRGDKPENPHMWDKSVGGHVTADGPVLSRAVFDRSAQREMAEELAIDPVIIADDALDYRQRLGSGTVDLTREALIRLIDYDPWLLSLRTDRHGRVWHKRGNIAVYAGVYDGPFHFADGEAEDQQSLDASQLASALQKFPQHYTDDLRQIVARYGGLLQAGLPLQH